VDDQLKKLTHFGLKFTLGHICCFVVGDKPPGLIPLFYRGLVRAVIVPLAIIGLSAKPETGSKCHQQPDSAETAPFADPRYLPIGL
jgi:hypothetical protein